MSEASRKGTGWGLTSGVLTPAMWMWIMFLINSASGRGVELGMGWVRRPHHYCRSGDDARTSRTRGRVPELERPTPAKARGVVEAKAVPIAKLQHASESRLERLVTHADWLRGLWSRASTLG